MLIVVLWLKYMVELSKGKKKPLKSKTFVQYLWSKLVCKRESREMFYENYGQV